MELLNYEKYLFVFAHFDDENTCAYLMQKLIEQGKEVSVLYITDSNAKGIGDVRKKEVDRALKLIGVPEQNQHFLLIPERTVFYNFYRVITELKKIADAAYVDCIMTLDYEGGHEEHDAAAFCASETAAYRKCPMYTTPTYHMENGQRVLTKEFISSRKDIITLEVTDASIKYALNDIYESQAQHMITKRISDQKELLRIMGKEIYYKVDPPFDFTQKPWKEVAYESHPTPYFKFDDFLKAIEKYRQESNQG